MGVVPRNPESVTSSTVSPMERIRVAFMNDTTIYESNSSNKGEGREGERREGERGRGERGGERERERERIKN